MLLILEETSTTTPELYTAFWVVYKALTAWVSDKLVDSWTIHRKPWWVQDLWKPLVQKYLNLQLWL